MLPIDQQYWVSMISISDMIKEGVGFILLSFFVLLEQELYFLIYFIKWLVQGWINMIDNNKFGWEKKQSSLPNLLYPPLLCLIMTVFFAFITRPIFQASFDSYRCHISHTCHGKIFTLFGFPFEVCNLSKGFLLIENKKTTYVLLT